MPSSPRFCGFLNAALGLAACAALVQQPGAAATLTVQNLNDNAAGSLRQLIETDADPGDTIVFRQGLTGTITLFTSLMINKNLAIQGPGAGIVAVSGNQQDRVFHVFAGKTVRISGLTIRDGLVRGTNGADCNPPQQYIVEPGGSVRGGES